jgi:hypothetical protein
MKKRSVKFVVEFDLPPGAKEADAREYVTDAVVSWCGSLKPPGADEEDLDGDPMFDLNRDSIEVKRFVRPKVVKTEGYRRFKIIRDKQERP